MSYKSIKIHLDTKFNGDGIRQASKTLDDFKKKLAEAGQYERIRLKKMMPKGMDDGEDYGFSKLHTSVKNVLPAMMALDRMMGGLDGTLGRVANGIKGVMSATMAFGKVGGVVSAVVVAIEAIANKFYEAEMKAINAAKALMEYNRTRIAAFQEDTFTNFVRGINDVVKATERASRSFEIAAQKRAELFRVSAGLDAARGESELIDLKRQMSDDVANVSDDDKSRVAAAWRVKIAEKEVELRMRAAVASAEIERNSIETAKKRLALAEDASSSLEADARKAEAEYKRIKGIFVGGLGDVTKIEADYAADNDPFVKRYKQVYEQAEARAKSAAAETERQAAALQTMEAESEVSAKNRANSIAAAENAVKDAEHAYFRAEDDYANAQMRAAQEAARERYRLDRELHQKRMDDLRAEIAAQNDAAAALKAMAADAQTEFERAFAMYRDPSRAAAEIAEERDRAGDLKRLHRDASRYGGKWRVDELSALMSAGDAAGVQSRLEEWRKSKSFTPEVEAMVRASAAEQTQTTVEDELRKIEVNTAGLAQKLDELLAVKGGS